LILVFGSINADLSFALDRLPVVGQTVVAERLVVQPGGKGANQAVAARRDGARVMMVGAMGDDALVAASLQGLRDAGVDLTHVVSHADTPTGCAAIWTDRDGRNQIVVALGANARVRADQVEAALLTSATTLVVQMETDPGQIATVIRRAGAGGCRVILNLAPAILLEAVTLRLVDLLVVNEDEAQTLADALGCDAAAAALHAELGVGVIRTLGADGAEAATDDGAFSAASPVVTVVDTTAAGDCFVGVLAAALDRGLPLRVAMRRACVAAALACTLAGSQRSLPDAAGIDAAGG
jgi:ribokinase